MPLLLLLALAAVAGDTTSAPAQATAQTQKAPLWVSLLPGGEIHQYFRGDATDGDYEKAKLKARADAYRKAVLWASKEGRSDTLVESLEISSAGSSALSSETTLTFDPATFKRIEWLADWSAQEFTNVYSSAGQRVYHYYCLIRIKKPSRNLFVQIGQGVGGRVDAVFHSALYPGWGQARQGRGGGFYMFFGTTLGITVGSFYIAETVAKDDPDKTWNKDTFRKFRKGSTYAFAGLYAANLVDALIFGHKAWDHFPAPGTSLVPGPDGRGIGVQWQLALR